MMDYLLPSVNFFVVGKLTIKKIEHKSVSLELTAQTMSWRFLKWGSYVTFHVIELKLNFTDSCKKIFHDNTTFFPAIQKLF